MFTFFCIVSRILLCALCSNRDMGAFESPRLPFSPRSCYVERLSALSLELQLGRARRSLGAPPSHPPKGELCTLSSRTPLSQPGDVSAQVGQLLPAVLGQASAGVRCPSSQPAVGGRERGDVTLIHNSCVQLHFPGKGSCETPGLGWGGGSLPQLLPGQHQGEGFGSSEARRLCGVGRAGPGYLS